MSYLQFHLVFILPPIALLALALRGGWRRLPRRAVWSLPALAVIAFLYTTPWDNYLVWRGVWGYGEARVIGVIGYVPVEEYLFFLLQPLLTGLWLYLLLAGGERPLPRPLPQFWGRGELSGARSAAPQTQQVTVSESMWVRGVGAAVYTGLALAGVPLLGVDAGVYLGLILVWAAPVLALQWLYAGGEIWRRRGVWLAGVAVPTLYLWVADAVAIRLGIWQISERYTTGMFLGNLPLEEAVFFLVTNLLVVQGLLLFLFPPGLRGAGAVPAQARHVPATLR